MKKWLAAVTALILLGTASLASAETYTVGICQILTHEAVAQAAQGFMDALDDALGKGAVTYQMKDASGDASICSLIINDFVADEVDLIVSGRRPLCSCSNS